MSMLLSLICMANRRAYPLPQGMAWIKRVFFFCWAYLAVGIAMPLQFMISGDKDLFRDWDDEDEAWKRKRKTPSEEIKRSFGDADYMTWCEIFIGGGWVFLASFPRTTCAAEYAEKQVASFFDYGVIAWAALCIIPLLLYKWRESLPSLWKLIGFNSTSEKYCGLAYANLLIVSCFFFTRPPSR